MRRWWNGLSGKWEAAIYMVLGYAAHLCIETFVLSNILAIFGWSIPVVV